MNFYPRSPCGERQPGESHASSQQEFLSTLSLRRATVEEVSGDTWTRDFYPRSPCGERRGNGQNINRGHNFYPRSPCGERRVTVLGIQHRVGISIHALLAESDLSALAPEENPTQFLSTLSLRRATVSALCSCGGACDFYPRSPCGERPSRTNLPSKN